VPPPACRHRSDSNGEDLEGYAGAGLYESITMDPTEMVRVDYNDDPITSDAGFRAKVRGAAARAAGAGRGRRAVVGAPRRRHSCCWEPNLPSGRPADMGAPASRGPR
jgi:hypothetical protein